MPWAQGSLIDGEDMVALGLAAADACWGVVVTHDCDLANDNLGIEPSVELIVAQPVSSPDGNCRHAKNARKLHLDWEGEAEPLCLELLATRKCQVDKAALASCHPVPGLTLTPAGQRILQSWLAARYRRQALPDSLVERLRHVVQRLERHGKTEAATVVGYWLSFSPARELASDDPYDLDISIVYTIDSPEAEEAAIAIAGDVSQRFAELVEKAKAGGVVLGQCSAYSEEEFTLHDIRHHVELRLDYLSNRAYPDGIELE
ncbi:hypothetical protein [Halomonas sp. LBP4]|uniref:hypothetical protein n=1 Tax=Halomonas sp. LBP4 TaxID=2044917 RepID=UPI0011B47928|nr:hypothetical protein [Halomonas sp. LBP4]